VQRAQPTPAQVASASRRVRRTRAATTFVLLVSLVTAFAQVSIMATGGAIAQSWLVLGISVAAVVGSVALLGRIAEVSRARSAPVVARPARRTSLGPAEAKAVKRDAEWTPVPVPKPMYLSRSVVEAAAAVEDPAFELKLAAVAAERALRNAEKEATPLRVAAASSSPFASMGIVDDDTTATPDLDAVLARRRA
jgi:hypothetical protein